MQTVVPGQVLKPVKMLEDSVISPGILTFVTCATKSILHNKSIVCSDVDLAIYAVPKAC